MIDFNILHGLSTDLFLESGVINPDLIIEDGHWYLCTDTAELFLGAYEECPNCANCAECSTCTNCSEHRLTLKKINANILDQVATSIINLEITNGRLIATYSDNTTVDLGSVVEDLPTNLSAFTNDVGYATKQEMSEAIASIPKVSLTGYATESWVNDQGFLTKVPEGFITAEELASEGFIKEHQSLEGYIKSEDISDFVTMADVEAKQYATEQYVDDAIAKQVPVDELAKKDDVVEVKTKLETVVLPTISETIIPKVEELVETAATQTWVEEQGYLTKHQDLSDYAKKTELFSGSYNDLNDTPEIPSIAGLASEDYVDRAIANIDLPIVDLSSYALKAEVKVKANDVPFTRSRLVTKAIGSFSAGEDVRGLTVAEILAKLLGLADSAEPNGIIEEIIAYAIPMYSVTAEGILAEIPYSYFKLNAETAADKPTTSGFYQIFDASGAVVESGYQEIQTFSNDIYYVIALPKEIDYNTMITIKGYNTTLDMWTDEVEKFAMTSDPSQVEMLCSEANIDVSRVDTSVYTIWASETCPTGSLLRYVINEKEAAI
jgi:hypothetical protein